MQTLEKQKPKLTSHSQMVSGDGKTFEVLEFLGRGASSKCYRAKSVDDAEKKNVALKIIPKKRLTKGSMSNYIQKEILYQRDYAHHKHLVRLLEYFATTKHTHLVLVLECCPHGNLFQLLHKRQKLVVSEVRWIVWALIDALEFLHGQKIVHRDVKLGNIFLHDHPECPHRLSLKLGDFGFADRVPQDGLSNCCGTPNYIAPEILKHERYDTRCDIWSLGVCTFALLYGRCPFETSSIEKTKLMIRQITEIVLPDTLPEVHSFLGNCLSVSPQERTMKIEGTFLDQPSLDGLESTIHENAPDFDFYESYKHLVIFGAKVPNILAPEPEFTARSIFPEARVCQVLESRRDQPLWYVILDAYDAPSLDQSKIEKRQEKFQEQEAAHWETLWRHFGFAQTPTPSAWQVR